MASQNIGDFLNTLGVMRATTASQPYTARKAVEKSNFSQDRISVFVDTTNSNDCSLCKYVCLFQTHTICCTESKECSIVLILILKFIKR